MLPPLLNSGDANAKIMPGGNGYSRRVVDGQNSGTATGQITRAMGERATRKAPRTTGSIPVTDAGLRSPSKRNSTSSIPPTRRRSTRATPISTKRLPSPKSAGTR